METTLLRIEDEALQTKSLVPSRISFAPYLEFLKHQAENSGGLKEKIYRFIIKKFNQHPELLHPLQDGRILKDHTELLSLVETSVFPLVNDDSSDLFALVKPMDIELFYVSEGFKKIIQDEVTGGLKSSASAVSFEVFESKKETMFYAFVLEKFYGIKLNFDSEMVFAIPDESTGLPKFYRIVADLRFIDIKTNAPLPQIAFDQLDHSGGEILNLELVKQELPLDLFSLEGFTILSITDVTPHQAIENLKNTLIHINTLNENEVFDNIEQTIRTLLGNNLIDVGVIPFLKVNDQLVFDDSYTARCVIQRKGGCSFDTASAYAQIAPRYMANPTPVILSRVPEDNPNGSAMLPGLQSAGIKSYIVLPVHHNKNLVGILELAASTPGALTSADVSVLQPVLPLLGQILQLGISGFSTKIEKIIKEKFTSLQPAVEWRFNEVAWQYLKTNGKHNTGVADIENVSFDDVYPVYGAVDIRNSSTERTLAIKKDFLRQLDVLHFTLSSLKAHLQIPLLDEMIFKCNKWAGRMSDVLTAEDELRIGGFFDEDVRPFLQHFERSKPEVADIVQLYFREVDPETGVVHLNRRQFDETVALINSSLLLFLEEEQQKLEKSYPNYFEKYRTDGVEYNIYIGQSIAPNRPFDELYLKNLRLWQLSSMAEIARMTHALLPNMSIPLQTTQLILVHNNPISISFRRDERRFDVEGAYNVRYEIMKKRIDKVHIKQTGERLTQPGKIALVYSNNREAEEYAKYIGYLQEKGYLNNDLEYLELEETQGIFGLMALRVGVVLE